MVNKKILVTICITLIYAVLFGLFIYFVRQSNGCSYSTPCIHFCSANKHKYADKELIEKFEESKSGKNMMEHYYRELKAIRGVPKCGEMTDWLPNDEVNSTDPPYKFNSYGSAIVDNKKYSVSRYCLEKDESVYDGWKLKTCYQDLYLQKGFHTLAIFISLSLLGFTLLVYAYYKELRDFYGKAIVALIASQLLAFVFIPLFRYMSSLKYSHRNKLMYFLIVCLITSLVMILLWITVIIVHLFFAFRNFKNKTSGSFEFSTYSIFVFSFALFSAFMSFDSLINFSGMFEYLIFTYFFIIFSDIILLIITGVNVLKVSRQLEQSEQSKFDTEKKWFWIILKLSLILFVTWIFEAVLFANEFNLFLDTTGDFLNILTATTITIILVGRERARVLLFQKYREVHDLETDME